MRPPPSGKLSQRGLAAQVAMVQIRTSASTGAVAARITTAPVCSVQRYEHPRKTLGCPIPALQRPRIKFPQPPAWAPSKLAPIWPATNSVPRVCTGIATRMHRDCNGIATRMHPHCHGYATRMHRELYGMSIGLLPVVSRPATNVRQRSRQWSHTPATSVGPPSRGMVPYGGGVAAQYCAW